MININELKNFEHSGFNDDSIISEEEVKQKNENLSRFLIKSNLAESSNSNKQSNNENQKDNNSKKKNSDNNNDFEIININTLKGGESSINSENEEHIKIKEEIKPNQNENDLNQNLLQEEDNNFLFNFKNKISKLSTIDEIMRDTIKISISRTNKFSNTKLSRTFIYEEQGKCQNYFIKSKKFGKSINNNIITYILNLYIFSEFRNFNDLEKDNRFKIFFIPLKKRKFSPNIENTLDKLKIQNEDSEHFIDFINGINSLLNDKEYNEIKKNNKKFKKCLYITNIILFLLIAGIMISFYFFYSFIFDQEKIIKLSIIISSIILTIILIITFIFKLIKLRKRKLYTEYNNLNYMLINYMRFNDYVEEWNKSFFENIKIRASVPISLNYIMFNLDPFQNIDIRHLDMKWLIERVYKNKNFMSKDKEFMKYFIKVRSTLFEGKNIYE